MHVPRGAELWPLETARDPQPPGHQSSLGTLVGKTTAPHGATGLPGGGDALTELGRASQGPRRSPPGHRNGPSLQVPPSPQVVPDFGPVAGWVSGGWGLEWRARGTHPKRLVAFYCRGCHSTAVNCFPNGQTAFGNGPY